MIYLYGDFINNNGPANANKSFLNGLKKNNIRIKYVKSNNHFISLLHLLLTILFVRYIIITSYSKTNKMVIRLSKIFGKKTIYLMHGFASYEKAINENRKFNIEEIFEIENYIFKNVNLIYCVSQTFMEFMKNILPEYSNKFKYRYNTIPDLEVNLEINNTEKSNLKNKKFKLVSTGGGMRRKNNLIVCKSIENIISKYDLEIEYIVVGNRDEQGNEIEQFNFVKYYDFIEQSLLFELISDANLYIQNSYFETFGLAIIEATLKKTNILVSRNVGSLGVYEYISEKNIIEDNESINEIEEKIYNIILEENKTGQSINISLINEEINTLKFINEIMDEKNYEI